METAIDLKGRNFLTLMDFTPDEIRYLLDLAHELKAKKKAGIRGTSLAGKNIALIFEKTSTRTRCSFEVAASDEGGYATFLDPKSSQMGKKESIADTAKVLGRFYDGIEFRGYSQETVEILAANAGVPVWNGLTDVDHPTQILADIMTIEEHISKPLNEVKVVFVGDIRNNMAYAWMYGCARMGMKFTAYGPEELADQVDEGVLEKALAAAADTGAEITISSDPECLMNADVIYTDIWASMGEEEQIPERVRMLTPFKVTEELMAATGNPDCLFMHCLPSFHNFETAMAAEQLELGYDIREVSEEVFSGKNSVVFDEAENRMHSIKAVMVATIGS
ncbi:MAG: ornithine carbamoyltransferase [Clostridiales bacterium]|nr:ornithine carbamoyltransferase [Clostridiales bacterium]